MSLATSVTTGAITLYADTECSVSPNTVLSVQGSDSCGDTQFMTSSFMIPSGGFGSFLIQQRPVCENGSVPYLSVYADQSCSQLVQSFPSDPTGPDADGSCVAANGVFLATAFVCNGVNPVVSVGGGQGDDDNSGFWSTDETISGQMSWMDATATAGASTEATAAPSASSTSSTASLSTSEPPRSSSTAAPSTSLPSRSSSTSTLSSLKTESTSTGASTSTSPTTSSTHTIPTSGASKIGSLLAMYMAAAVMFGI